MARRTAFVLRQEVELYRVYQQRIADCGRQLRRHLESFGSTVDLQAQPLGRINGMDVLTAQM